MSAFKGILNTWEKEMSKPVVNLVGVVKETEDVIVRLSGQEYQLHCLKKSKVNPSKHLPMQFTVESVYKFPMHEDMRLTIKNAAVYNGYGYHPSEVQFVYNEEFLKAVLPQEEKKEEKYLYAVENINSKNVIVRVPADSVDYRDKSKLFDTPIVAIEDWHKKELERIYKDFDNTYAEYERLMQLAKDM